MFKDLLIDWVTELNEKIAAVGDSGYLTISLSAFNPTLPGLLVSSGTGQAGTLP